MCAGGTDFSPDILHNTGRLTDAAVFAVAAVQAFAAFGGVGDAGLQQLVGRDPEEVRHAV